MYLSTDAYTWYLNIVYEGNKLSYVLADEGRLVNAGTASAPVFVREYAIKDHLGNSRVVFMGSALGGGGAIDVVQTASYYPFGLTLSNSNATTTPTYPKNRYMYNGKELQNETLNRVYLGGWIMAPGSMMRRSDAFTLSIGSLKNI